MIIIKVQGKDTACAPNQIHDCNNNNVYTNNFDQLENCPAKIQDLAFTKLESIFIACAIIITMLI